MTQGINWFNGLEIASREIEQQEGKHSEQPDQKLRIKVLKAGTKGGYHREQDTP